MNTKEIADRMRRSTRTTIARTAQEKATAARQAKVAEKKAAPSLAAGRILTELLERMDRKPKHQNQSILVEQSECSLSAYLNTKPSHLPPVLRRVYDVLLQAAPTSGWYPFVDAHEDEADRHMIGLFIVYGKPQGKDTPPVVWHKL